MAENNKTFATPERRPEKDTRSTSPFQRNKCVCEVCNCNTHKCPKETQPCNKIVPVSHRDYKQPNEFTKASPFRPQRDYTPTKSDPNHFKTTNQMNFHPNYFQGSPPVERVKKGAMHQPSSESRAKLPGFYDTEYHSSIAKEKPFNYTHSARPKEKPLKSLPFDAKSTYQQNFHPFDALGHNSLVKTPDNLKIDSKTPFDSKSHYKNDYQPYNFEKRPDYFNKNKETHIMTPIQMDRPESHYKNCYQLYSKEYYSRPECPMKYLPTPPRYLASGKAHIVYDDENDKWV